MNRIERLTKEYEKMQELVSQSALISFKAGGKPPDRYTVTFTCAGLAVENGVLLVREEHIAVIYLHSNFPTQPPRLTWRTPIFHPNFRDAEVCLGDGWVPSRTIAQLCLTLGEMVQYKNYNIDDPLDGIAARWARVVNHIDPTLFPVDDRNLLDPVTFLTTKRDSVATRLEQLEAPTRGDQEIDDIVLTSSDVS